MQINWKNAKEYSVKENIILSFLWNKLFDNFVRETYYMAVLAGLSAQATAKSQRLLFEIYGYNDSLESLLQTYFEKIAQFGASAKLEDFTHQYQNLQKNYLNFFTSNALNQAQRHMSNLTQSESHSIEEMLATLESITYEKFLDYSQGLFAKAAFEWLIIGNLSREAAFQISDKIEK